MSTKNTSAGNVGVRKPKVGEIWWNHEFRVRILNTDYHVAFLGDADTNFEAYRDGWYTREADFLTRYTREEHWEYSVLEKISLLHGLIIGTRDSVAESEIMDTGEWLRLKKLTWGHCRNEFEACVRDLLEEVLNEYHDWRLKNYVNR